MSVHAIIMAGGTGGHIYPALAVAAELSAQGASVSWLGTRRGLESQLVPKAGIEIDYIEVEGIRGRGILTLLKAPWVLSKAVCQARQILRQRHTKVVVGFGGFVAGPGGVAAKITGLPLVIHEQNAVAGTTNRLLSRLATRVFTAFPRVLAKGQVVGNPVRKEIASLPNPSERKIAAKQSPLGALNLLVLGGSLGATAINERIPAALASIRQQSDVTINVVHQCGQKNLAQTQACYAEHDIELNDRVAVQPFVDDMAAAYQWADFIVCRAGALTVSEIAAAGCAALMVPFPHAIDDHQTANAKWLVDANAARLCQQSDLTVERLVRELMSVVNQPSDLFSMASNARSLAEVNAAEKVAEACFEVINRGH